MSRGDTTDSLSVEWKLPELRERLTILVIVGIRTEEHRKVPTPRPMVT